MKQLGGSIDTETREGAAPSEHDPDRDPFRLLLIATTGATMTPIDLADRRAVTIGRGEVASVRLADPSLSRLHARFERDGHEVRVRDLGSRNGTWLSGKRIEQERLQPGDQVVLGGVTVSVHAISSARIAMLGLISSASLQQRLDEEWLRAQLCRRTLSVVVLRPFRNQQVSLGAIAIACSSKLRPIDRVGLFDRGSIVALLPEVAGPAAAQLARDMVAPVAGRAPIVAGVASFPASGTTPEQLLGAAWRAAREASLATPVASAPDDAVVRGAGSDEIVRESAATRKLQQLVERVAARPLSVLVLGETGTGKELIAHELHQKSERAKGPLRIVSCAAIPSHLIESVLFGHVKGAFTGADRDHAGVFEQARGGTIFLDEVGELSPNAQAALLRVLDSRTLCRVGGTSDIAIDVRVVAATHRDLAAMVEDGTFRLDLYHRLSALVLELPPLRDRREEILPLAERFLSRSAAEWGGPALELSATARQLLEAYAWPGNVRELRNVIERATALCEGAVIEVDDLPAHLQAPVTTTSAPPAAPRATEDTTVAAPSVIVLRERERELELKLIVDALDRFHGNQRRAAEALQLPLRTLQRRLQQLRLRAAVGEAPGE